MKRKCMAPSIDQIRCVWPHIFEFLDQTKEVFVQLGYVRKEWSIHKFCLCITIEACHLLRLLSFTKLKTLLVIFDQNTNNNVELKQALNMLTSIQDLTIANVEKMDLSNLRYCTRLILDKCLEVRLPTNVISLGIYQSTCDLWGTDMIKLHGIFFGECEITNKHLCYLQYFPNVQSIAIYKCEIKGKLTFLEKCPHIKQLMFYPKFKPQIDSYENVEVLTLCFDYHYIGFEPDFLESLKTATHLKILTLENYELLHDLKPLKSLKHLRKLFFKNPKGIIDLKYKPNIDCEVYITYSQ